MRDTNEIISISVCSLADLDEVNMGITLRKCPEFSSDGIPLLQMKALGVDGAISLRNLESVYNAFTLSPKKWIQAMNAIEISSKSGRYGGTFAHKDIAFEFVSWISAEFKLYIIKDYQRLKSDETSQARLEWNVSVKQMEGK